MNSRPLFIVAFGHVRRRTAIAAAFLISTRGAFYSL